MTDDLSREAIEAAVTGRFGTPCRYFDEIPSTNSEALAWAIEGAPEGAIVVADHQTRGRGRRGRVWHSAPGTSIQFSLVLRPKLTFDKLGLLSLCLGVACAEAIEERSRIPARTKWPNDVVIGDRKLAGILVETKLTGREVDAAVVGIGLNMDWSSASLPPEFDERVTDVAREAAGAGLRAPARVEMLASLLGAIERNYGALQGRRASRALLKKASDRSAILGRAVMVRLSNGEIVRGRARRLLTSGALELETEGGRTAVHAGEIEHLRSGSDDSGS